MSSAIEATVRFALDWLQPTGVNSGLIGARMCSKSTRPHSARARPVGTILLFLSRKKPSPSLPPQPLSSVPLTIPW